MNNVATATRMEFLAPPQIYEAVSNAGACCRPLHTSVLKKRLWTHFASP